MARVLQHNTKRRSAQAKRVILTVGSGGLDRGFPVTLQIGVEGAAATTELVTTLAPDGGLIQCFADWKRAYGDLGRGDAEGSWLGHRPLGIPKTSTDAPTADAPTADAPTAAPGADALGLKAALANCDLRARQLGDRFNDWLRQPAMISLREAWLEKLQVEDELRVILQTQDQLLQRLPWHQWELLERYPNAELSLGSVGYDLAPTGAPDPAPVVSAKILAILGDSSDIDIQGDRALLSQLPDAEVTFLAEPQRSELTDQLWQQPWRILFFAGHSGTDQDGNHGSIRINPHQTLSLEQLKYGLRRAVTQGLQLAIFNSCDGLGLAREFADLNIPQLIVMREPVPDRVAQAFLKYFLAAYTEGTSFYRAVRQARERLQAMEGEFPCATWLPIICQNPAARPPTWQALTHPAPPQQSGQLPRPAAKTPLTWRSRLGSLGKALTLSLGVTAGLLALRHSGWLQPWELRAYDQLLRLRPQEFPDARLLVITVTEDDVQAQRDQQPRGSLSDSSLSQLLTRLNQAEPRAIGLDIYRDYAAESPLLAQQLRETENLISVCGIKSNEMLEIAPPPEVPPERQAFSDSVVDPDQVLRRHLLAVSPPVGSSCTDESGSYGLSTLLALQYLADQGIVLEQLNNGDWHLGKARIRMLGSRSGSYQTADTSGYQTLLNYRSARSLDNIFQQVSLGQMLSGQVQDSRIRDRIVLIGTTAESFRDYTATPYSQASPGVLLQAQMVSQLLSAALDGRPLLWIAPWWGDLLWIGGWSGAGAALAVCLGSYGSSSSSSGSGPRAWAIGLVTGSVLHYGLCVAVLLQAGLWLPLVPASLAFLASAGLVGWSQRSSSRPQQQISGR